VPLAALAAALALASPALFARASPTDRSRVIDASPWASLTVDAVHRIADLDRDGWSPLFGGGDCDDLDRRRHPGAPEVLGDGIDEDCSGADAVQFEPVREPAVAVAGHPDLNVVMVLVDALRPDHLGFVGYERPTSPEIDRFRASATWFPNVYSDAPSTRYALPSIFTGHDLEELPEHHDVYHFELFPPAFTLAEALSARGYATVGYTISWVVQHMRGIGQGFDIWNTPWLADDWARIEGQALHAPLTTDASLRFLDAVPAVGPTRRSYLLFAHYQCTHWPYVPHDQWNFGDSLVDHYDSALAYCDQQIGRLLRAIEARADYDQTAVIVFSDHGEMLGEHGAVHEHGMNLYEPDLRSVLLVRTPAPHRATVNDVVSLTDLGPTIAGFGNVPAFPVSTAWDLAPMMAPEGAARAWPPRPIFLYTQSHRGVVHSDLRGVLDGHTKYVHDLRSGAEQLFDRARDPAEANDVCDARRAECQRLAELVAARARWIAARPASP
jgi:arylsulfatase A-like enzyme